MLSRALQTSQNDLDNAVSKLGKVESERLDGIARIEASQQRIEDLKVQTEKKRDDANAELTARIESFRKFTRKYWEKEEKFHAQIGCMS